MHGPSPDSDGAGPVLTTSLACDPAILLTALGALMASQTLSELAASAAKVPDELLGVRQTVVMLRGQEGVVVAGHPFAGGALEAWARELLLDDALRGPTSTGQQLAVGIEAREAGVRGVIALDLSSVVDDELGRRFVELARLVSTCADQIISRDLAARALKDARASLAKGLHDLRTPLNSLRLGMHLLEPGLAGQDPAIVQRTHRAVDRMAALVTEMFDALHKN